MIVRLRGRQLAFDVVVAGGLGLLGLVWVGQVNSGSFGPWLDPIVLGILVFAVALRRMFTLGSLGLAWLAALLQLAAGGWPSPNNLLMLLVLYATACVGTRLVRWAGFASALAGAAVVTLYLTPKLGAAGYESDVLSNLLLGTVLFVLSATAFLLAWTAGLLVRQWRSARTSRAAAARAEYEVAAEQERTRIARDMHDVVAHSLAVVIAQADGARYLRRVDPDAAEEALQTISGTAREALADVRVLLEQLRHSQGTAPQPVIADLDRLYEQFSSSGLELSRAETGRPLVLATGTQLAVYRIVQEALTNALRHGDRSRAVAVRFDWTDGGLHLVIWNALAPAGTGTVPVVAQGSGHGLVGMTERASLVGGRLSAGAADGGWVVRTWLPLDQTGAIRVATAPVPAPGTAVAR